MHCVLHVYVYALTFMRRCALIACLAGSYCPGMQLSILCFFKVYAYRVNP